MASLEPKTTTQISTEQQRKQNKIIDSIQSAKSQPGDSNKQLSLSSSSSLSTLQTQTTQQSQQQPQPTTFGADKVVYDVEHLATFSTTGTCHETNNGSTINNGIRNNHKCNTNAAASSSKSGSTNKPTTLNENSTTSNESAATSEAEEEDDDDELDRARIATSNQATTPKVALQRLFELEKSSSIWTQRMQIELRADSMLIIDCETNAIVETFKSANVTRPEALNQYNDIYNNIVVFIIQQPKLEKKSIEKEESDELEKEIAGEIHIFQCVSHKAQQLVNDILNWKSESVEQDLSVEISKEQKMNKVKKVEKNQVLTVETNNGKDGEKSKKKNKDDDDRENEKVKTTKNNKTLTSGNNANLSSNQASSKAPVLVQSAGGIATGAEDVPIVNVNVKETVQVFNQIAALREKGKSSSPTNVSSRPVSDATSSTSPQNGNVNSQAYKQRSIRASLAPKLVDSNQNDPSDAGLLHKASQSELTTSKTAHLNPNNNSSSASSSEAAHSSSSSSSNTNYYNNNNQQQQQRHATGINHNRTEAEQAKQAARLSHQVSSSSSSPAQQQQQQLARHHHKSSSKTSRHQQQRTQSDSSRSLGSSSSQSQLDQITTNESYVSVLNHCFDDIEKFIIRVQQAVAAIRELHAKRKLSKRSTQDSPSNNNASSKISGSHNNARYNQSAAISSADLALLQAKARGPNEADYFEILSKFKLAFNLLAKLKGCIHKPNAPELVHFLFTPLAIIIESARNAIPPIDPTLVGIPYLNQDALDLLSNCCTSKESDLWVSLGPNWTQTIDMSLLKASRLPSSFQPIFSDGWAPIIGELELIGLGAPFNDTHKKTSTNNNTCSKPDHYAPAEIPRQANYKSNEISQDLDQQDYLEAEQSGYSASKPSLSKPSKRNSADPYQRPFQAPYDYMEHPTRVTSSSGLANVEQQSSKHQSRAGRASRQNLSNKLACSQHPSDYLNALDPPHALQHNYASSQRLLNQEPDLRQANNSDDYSELQEQLLEQRHSRGPPVGSHYRESKIHYNNHRERQHKYNYHNQAGPYRQQAHQYQAQAEYLNELEQEAMLLDLGPAQTEWFYELQMRGALMVRVLFTREANNDKELSVSRGEILEVLDDTRKWWRARNIELQVAHVPHTIVAIMQGYQTLDELLANSPAGCEHLLEDQNLVNQNIITNNNNNNNNNMRYMRQSLEQQEPPAPHWHGNGKSPHQVEEKRNSRNGPAAFRYF